MSKIVHRTAVIGAAIAVGTFGFAPPATAHVTLSESEAEAGSYARVDFRVPNESDDAGTDKLEVKLPEQYPFTSVSTIDVPGWKVEVKTEKLDEPIEAHGREFDEAASTITWEAEDADAEIGVGEFGEFGVTLGAVPDKVGDTMVFKVVQTYSDGEEAPWIEAPQEDEAEPEHPAPTLTIVEASDSGHGDDSSATDENEAATAASGTGSVSMILGVAGLAAGVTALVVASLAYRRATRA